MVRVKGVLRPSRWTGSLFPSSAVGVRFGVGAAVGLWAGDVALLGVSRGRVTASQWFQAMGAALWVAVTTGIIVGALLGPPLVYVVSSLVEALRPKWAALKE